MARSRRVAQLNVGLVARTRKFTRGLRRVGKSLGRFTRRVAGVIKRVATLGTVMLSVAGVAGFGVMIRQSLKAVDSMANLARSLDTSIGFMQRMEYHSSLAGVELSSLEGALKRFDRRVRIAAATGQRADFLQQMGLDARHLAEMPLENKLVTFAQALEQNVRPAERVAYAYQLFGQQAQEMMFVLDNLPSGLKDARAAIEEMGIGLDSFDSKRVEQFNDQMFKLQFQVKGIAQQITASLAPVMSEVLEHISEWIKGVDDWGEATEKAIDTASEALKRGIRDIQTYVGSLEEIMKFLKRFHSAIIDFYPGMRESVELARKQNKWVEETTVKLSDYAEQRIQKLKEEGEWYGRFGHRTEGIMDRLERAANSLGKEQEDSSSLARRALMRHQGGIEGLLTHYKRLGNASTEAGTKERQGAQQSLEAMQAVEEKRKEMAQKAEQMKERFRTPLQVFRDRIQEINEVWQSGLIDIGTYTRAVRDAKSNLLDATGVLDTFERKRREGAMQTGDIFRSAVFQRAERGAGQTRIDYDREQVRELQQQTGLLQRLVGNTQEGLGAAI